MLAIDTLKLAEDLKKGGFDERQTATLVDLGRELSDRTLEKVATKDDLKAGLDGLRKDMAFEIGSLRKDMAAEMSLLEKLSKRRLKRGIFHSVVDLQAAINRWTIIIGGAFMLTFVLPGAQAGKTGQDMNS